MDHQSQHPLKVRVLTTSGVFPHKGFEHVPAHEKVHALLAKAAIALHLADTQGWIAMANGVRMDPHKTFREHGLHGHVELDWGPDHGGGGDA